MCSVCSVVLRERDSAGTAVLSGCRSRCGFFRFALGLFAVFVDPPVLLFQQRLSQIERIGDLFGDGVRPDRAVVPSPQFPLPHHHGRQLQPRRQAAIDNRI